MPRRKIIIRREYLPDPKHDSDVVTRLVGHITKAGRKNIAERIIYASLDIVGEKTKKPPIKVFKQALDNVKPLLEVRSRRVGGSTYQVPIEVRPSRRVTLALRWIVEYAKARPGRTMEEKLSAEIIDASNNTGASIKKKEDMHKMAEANKAFAHYRW